MDATILRKRTGQRWKEDREQYIKRVAEVERLWQQGLSRIEYQDELDERHLAQGQSVRSTHNAQKRGVERLFKHMYSAFTEVYFPDEDSNKLYEEEWGEVIISYFEERIPESIIREQRIAQNRKDVKNNFLYEEWLRQAHSPNGCKTYAAYALFTALKSAFLLMTAKPGGDQLIRVFYSGELPDRELLLKIVDVIDVTSPSNHEVMSWLIAVPNMMEVAEALIHHYSDFVRAERVDKADGPVLHSPLPDDPLEQSLPDRYDIPMDIRIENAVEAYKAKEGGADKVAAKYQIPQKQFRQVLQDRGLIGQRGGDRKGKSVE